MARTKMFPNQPRGVNGTAMTAPLGRSVAPFTRWALYVWMASLPFDVVIPAWLPQVMQGFLSIPRLAAAVLVICFIVDPTTRPWRLPPASLAFGGFFCVFAVSILCRPDTSSGAMVFQQFQSLILFFVCYNVFVTGGVMKGALFSYAASCTAASVMTLTGLVVDPFSNLVIQGREAAFGADPNLYSMLLVIGIIIAIGMAHVRRDRQLARVPVLWGIVLVNMIAVAKSASRGSSLGLATGLLAFVCSKGSFWMRVRNLFLLGVVGAVAFFVMMQSKTFSARWMETLESGAVSQRKEIFAEAFTMVQEKPLVGWGDEARSELAQRLFARGSIRATHNMVLTILTYTGLAGFTPYIWGYITVLLASWRSRTGPEGILPLMIFLAFFVTDMSTGGLPDKLHWTLFSYQLAAGQLVVLAAKDRVARPATPLQGIAAKRPRI